MLLLWLLLVSPFGISTGSNVELMIFPSLSFFTTRRITFFTTFFLPSGAPVAAASAVAADDIIFYCWITLWWFAGQFDGYKDDEDKKGVDDVIDGRGGEQIFFATSWGWRGNDVSYKWAPCSLPRDFIRVFFCILVGFSSIARAFIDNSSLNHIGTGAIKCLLRMEGEHLACAYQNIDDSSAGVFLP